MENGDSLTDYPLEFALCDSSGGGGGGGSGIDNAQCENHGFSYMFFYPWV